MADEESDDLLRWLQEGMHAPEQDDAEAIAAEWLSEAQRRGELQADQVSAEDALRSVGLNRIEREEFTRSRASQRKTKNRRHEETQLKRYVWHIKDRIPDWREPGYSVEYAAGTWYELTKGNLDLAISWWDAGLHPNDLVLITELSKRGLRPRDLIKKVRGRSIIEHLRRGNSLEWCSLAAGWPTSRK